MGTEKDLSSVSLNIYIYTCHGLFEQNWNLPKSM